MAKVFRTSNSPGYGHSPEQLLFGRRRGGSKEMESHSIPIRFVGQEATGVMVRVEGKPVTFTEADEMSEVDDLEQLYKNSNIADTEHAGLELPPLKNDGHGKSRPVDRVSVNFDPGFQTHDSSKTKIRK